VGHVRRALIVDVGTDHVVFSEAYGGLARPMTLLGGDGSDSLAGSAGDDLIVGGTGAPSWLATVNRDWAGNYRIRC
jgi:hypothetical protein